MNRPNLSTCRRLTKIAVFLLLLWPCAAFGQVQTLLISTPTPTEIINARDYGVFTNGASEDDTPLLQAAIDAAATASKSVYLPAGTYRLNTTLLITTSGNAGTVKFVSVYGEGPELTRLHWHGSTSGTAVKVTLNKQFKFFGFTVYNQVAAGTTIGLLLTGPLDIGTQTLSGEIEKVSIGGFSVGCQAGAATAKDSSEIIYTNCNFANNGTGWLGTGSANTLNHLFLLLGMEANGIGIQSSGGGSVTVIGGSSSNETISDFHMTGDGGPLSIRDYRSETPAKFVTTALSDVQDEFILIDTCVCESPGSGIAVEVGRTTTLDIRNSRIVGKVYLPKPTSSLTMVNNRVHGDNTTKLPFWTDDSGTDYDQSRGYYYVYNNLSTSPSFRCTDETGTFDDWVRTAIRGRRGDETVFESPTESLNRARMLGFGSYVDGRNLRLQETFSSSGTKAVTFIRNVSPCTVADQSVNITVPSGSMTSADLGKKIVLVNAGPGGVGNITTFIKSINSATQISIPNRIGALPGTASSSITATIGENEPDANYMLMLGTSAQETISWSSKATTGFTLTSSNASSTATVDVLVVR